MGRNEIEKEMDQMGIPRFKKVSKVMKHLGGTGDIDYAIRLNIYAAEKYARDCARRQYAEELKQWDVKVKPISPKKLAYLLFGSFRKIIDDECTMRGYERKNHWLQIGIPLGLFFKEKFNWFNFREQFRRKFNDANIAESLDNKLSITWGIGEFGSTVIKGAFRMSMQDFGTNYLKIL